VSLSLHPTYHFTCRWYWTEFFIHNLSIEIPQCLTIQFFCFCDRHQNTWMIYHRKWIAVECPEAQTHCCYVIRKWCSSVYKKREQAKFCLSSSVLAYGILVVSWILWFLSWLGLLVPSVTKSSLKTHDVYKPCLLLPCCIVIIWTGLPLLHSQKKARTCGIISLRVHHFVLTLFSPKK